MPEEPHTPKHRQQHGGKSHAMGNRVICATPHRGKAVNNYSLGDRLGKGAFAVVYKAIHLRTGEVAAIKQIPLEKIKSVDGVMGEIELLQDLEHPNIVKYFGFMKDDINLNIVLEYCENGSLATILHKFGSFPENLLARYMRQVLEGLEYLHKQGTIHRDIKGANILTTKNGIAKLADFGVATKIGGSEPGKGPGMVGTPHWMAPEIIQMEEPSPACDVWSLGATIVELRSGQPPFGNRGDIPAMYAIVQEDSLSIIPSDSSGKLRDFLMLCFEKDPALRVPASSLLLHAWIRNYGQDEKMVAAVAEKEVKAFNSPSRRRLNAVPSRLNLRVSSDSLKRAHNELSPVKPIGTSIEDDNYEDDFDDLGIFNGGTTKEKNILQPSLLEKSPNKPGNVTPASKRKPLAAFMEDSYEDEKYDNDYDNVQSLMIGVPPAKDSNNSDGSELHAGNNFNGPINLNIPPSHNRNVSGTSSDLSLKSIDPFTGLDDLLDDDVDEMLLSAQQEAKALSIEIQSSNCNYSFVYKRLKELVLSKPQVRNTFEQLRLLPMSLSILNKLINEKKSADQERMLISYITDFFSLVEACFPVENGGNFVTKFCIAGGLSFLLAQSKILPSHVLRLLTKMTSTTSMDDKIMPIAGQLAFREDAIGVVCSFFDEKSHPSDILRASFIIIEMFRVCGPRNRSNLWHHFNAYGLFGRLVNLLHLKCVIANESTNSLALSLYELIESFSRTPQELLLSTIDHKILRRLMRAYKLLPKNSKHRKLLLEFFKNMSTLPQILDEMQKGKIAPHLIVALDEAMTASAEYPNEARSTANCLVPTLFNYTCIENSRKTECASHDLLLVLKRCVAAYPGLREFVFPVYFAFVRANSDECWISLWEINALEEFIALITETGWQAMAIASIATWIRVQQQKVTPLFIPYVNSVVTALDGANGVSFEGILSSVASLLDANRFLCGHLDTEYLFNVLTGFLNAPQLATSSALVQALQIIAWVVNENVGAKDALLKTGLFNLLLELQNNNNKDIPVPCIKLIDQISNQTGLEA